MCVCVCVCDPIRCGWVGRWGEVVKTTTTIKLHFSIVIEARRSSDVFAAATVPQLMRNKMICHSERGVGVGGG